MTKLRTFALLGVIFIVFLSILSACGKSEQAKDDGGPLSLVKSYDTLDQLITDAEEIAEIKVLSQETITYQDVPFTISTVMVQSSIQGTFKKGDTVRIIETGGEFTPTDKQGNPLPKQTFKFNGIPVLEKNEHNVVFLRKFVGPQIKGEAYVPLGVYQGRFKVDSNGDLIQQAPDREKLKDYVPSKLDKFSETIKSKNNNK